MNVPQIHIVTDHLDQTICYDCPLNSFSADTIY